MNRDLTVGKPGSVLWKFCLPLFGSVIFQQLYNIADSFVAGKFISEEALAAVGNSYEVTLIFIAVAFGCNIGCSVITSQLFGAKKFGEMKTAVYTTLIASGVLCLALMTGGICLCTNILGWMHTPENILADSRLYLSIYIWGLPFVIYYNIATGIFSALGDSKTPFIFLMFSSVVNIGMDILFVTALSPIFPRGVDGVAWATFICQGISSILAVVCVFRRLRKIKAEDTVRAFSPKLLKKVAAIAIPSMLQQGFISVGNIYIQSVINTFGSGVIAGYSAAIKLNNLVITSFTTLANGVSNFSAQNIGAQKWERIHEGFKAGLRLIWILCIPFVLLYFFLGRYFILFFMDAPTEAAMSTGIIFLRIVTPFYFIVSLKLISDGTLRGAGKMKEFMTGTVTDLLLRIILCKIFSLRWGSVGIWAAWPFGWIISTAVSLWFYRKGKWYPERVKQEV